MENAKGGRRIQSVVADRGSASVADQVEECRGCGCGTGVDGCWRCYAVFVMLEESVERRDVDVDVDDDVDADANR